MSARDTQRSRVYGAEALVRRIFDQAESTGVRTLSLHGSTITLPVERRFGSVESIQSYTDAVLALNWVEAMWPGRAATPIRMRERRGQTSAHYERATATIAIPPYAHNRSWAMREFVVLHEIAHHLAPDPVAAPHGPRYVGRFAILVGEIIGVEAGFLLTTTMRESGARISSEPASALCRSRA